MSYYAVSDTTVIAVNPKAGSMAMKSSISLTPFAEVTAELALAYDRRVMFVRDPIERVNSLFNMFYHLASGSSDFGEMVPHGIILAYGVRVGSFVGLNDHRYVGETRALCEARIAAERAAGLSDTQIINKLNNEDYKRFIDYILAGSQNDHWGQQTELSTHNGQLVPNILHDFNTIATYWQDYATAPIQKENSWPAVAHDEYRLADLRAFYADDIALMGTL